jgi:hypothetical protein
MFAKNKPSRRIPLPENNWVELQYLSKGQKDEYRGAVAGVFKGALKEEQGGTVNRDMSQLPEDFILKTKQAEYHMVAQAIKAWSAESVSINAQAVAELDEEAYDLILAEITAMNELAKSEIKN